MRTQSPTNRLLPLFTTALLLSGAAGYAQDWVHSFSAVRVCYVAPGASGSGTEASPMSFATAISSANPGDLYWLMPGTYVGRFRLTRSGTAANPIVFRAIAAERIVIDGAFEITGAHNWIWGFEITDPTRRAPQDSGVRILAPGVHVLNNVVHHQANKNGIGAWNSGAGQVVYGNVIYENGQGPNHPHNIYTQNDFSTYGRKYIVENLILDAADVCGGCFNFHAYTEGGFIKGFHLEGNVVSNGRFLIGGYNQPADNEVLIGNFFYDSQAQFGYARPTQVEFRSNFLARTTLDIQWYWGDGETVYTQPAPNVFTNNQIILPAGPHIRFRTSAYLSSGRCEGCPRIRSVDVFNNNSYSTPFSATFFANNSSLGTVDFNTWKSATSSAGRAFDANSTVVAVPSGAKVVLLPNDYEPGRGHLAIFNWSGLDDVTVDLSSVVKSGAAFSLYPAKDVYGTPAVSGVYSGPMDVPVSGAEFSVFVVVSDVATNPTPAITLPTPGATLTGSSVNFQWTANGGTVNEWMLSVGSTLGGADLFDSGSLGTATSRTVTGLPTDGRNLFVRLSYRDGSGWHSQDAQYKAATLAVGAAITTPTPGSVLSGSSATFQWTLSGGAVHEWRLTLGTTVGGTNIFNGSPGTGTSASVTGLPVNGSTVHARLLFRDDAGWKFVDYQYTAATIGTPAITSPIPGSVFTGTTVNFQWTTNGTTVLEWRLTLGSTVGGADLYDSGSLGTATSVSVAGLPTDGRTVHARLFYRNNSGWLSRDHQYTATTAAGTPEITTPVPGTTLTGTSALFQWKSNGAPVVEWWLYAGSSAGGKNYFDSGSLGTKLSVTVTGLPTNGERIHIRLWYRDGSGWHSKDYQYSGTGAPMMTSPTPGIVLSGANVTFQWAANGSGVTSWWLYVGSSPGTGNYFNSGALGASTLSATASGLPTNGTTVYVRLWYMVNNGWNTIDFQYKAATLGVPPAPAMVGPTPGTVLPGPIVLFQWSGNGTAVSSWWLYAGSTLGGREYFDSGSLSTLSVTVNGLPTNGSTVYVRLWHGIAGAWSSSDYNYKAANIGGGPAIVAPVPGSKLPGSSATFQWTANGTSVTNWWLYAGSTVGGRNYYDSGALGTSLATTVVGLPTNGTTVYVRLWYMTGGTWQTRDYQYTAP